MAGHVRAFVRMVRRGSGRGVAEEGFWAFFFEVFEFEDATFRKVQLPDLPTEPKQIWSANTITEHY